LEFINERSTYFTKFTIQYVIYVIKQSVSPKMFTNESFFTIQRLLYQDSTAMTLYVVKPKAIIAGITEIQQPNSFLFIFSLIILMQTSVCIL
jgi:hypothetical protein